jgi:hypothetical protein
MANWARALFLGSSQGPMDTLSARPMTGFEQLGTHTAEMTITAHPNVERIEMIGHVGQRKLSILVDLFPDQTRRRSTSADAGRRRGLQPCPNRYTVSPDATAMPRSGWNARPISPAPATTSSREPPGPTR